MTVFEELEEDALIGDRINIEGLGTCIIEKIENLPEMIRRPNLPHGFDIVYTKTYIVYCSGSGFYGVTADGTYIMNRHEVFSLGNKI